MPLLPPACRVCTTCRRSLLSLSEPEPAREELYSQYFLSHHLVFSPDMEASTTDQILPMVAHNLGIGFYPEALASEPIARGEVLPIRLVEPIPEREICLIRDTSRPESIAARKLMEYLQRDT